MSEAPQMNDVAARSPTGEILDQTSQTSSPLTPPTDTSTTTSTEAPSTTEQPQATTDAKPPADGDAKPPVPATGPPEKYEFVAPEGGTLDPKAYEAALPVFKELGLTNDQAQKLINLQASREAALAKAPGDAISAMRTDWQGKIKADPDILAATSGGKTGVDAVLLDIARAKAALPPDLRAEFSDAMNITGAGDHPAVVKALWKLSQYVTEGSHVAGKGPSAEGQTKPGSTSRPDAASALYPNLTR